MSLAAAAAIRQKAWFLAAAVIGLDQLSKYIMRTSVVPDWQVKIEIAPFLRLVHYWNEGIGFGLMAGGPLGSRWALIVITLIITGVVIWWLMNAWRQRPAFGYGLIIGGALSNIIDRLLLERQAVFDFLEFHINDYYWPAFNLADSAIVLGVAVLLWDMVMDRTKPQITSAEDE